MPRKKPKLIPKGDSLMRLIKDMDRMVVEGCNILPEDEDVCNPSKRAAFVSVWNDIEKHWRESGPRAENPRPSRAKPGAGPRGRKPTSGMPKSFARRGINTLDGLQKKLRVVALHKLAPNMPSPAYFLKGPKYKKKPKTLVDSLALVGYILPGRVGGIEDYTNNESSQMKDDVLREVLRSKNSTCSVRTLTEWRQKACRKTIMAYMMGGLTADDWEELRFKIVERFGDGGTYFLTEPEVWVEFLDAGTMPYKVLVEPLSEDIKGFLSFYHTAERTWSSERSHQRQSIKIVNDEATRQTKVKLDTEQHHLMTTETEILHPHKQPRMDVVPESWPESTLSTYFAKDLSEKSVAPDMSTSREDGHEHSCRSSN